MEEDCQLESYDENCHSSGEYEENNMNSRDI